MESTGFGKNFNLYCACSRILSNALVFSCFQTFYFQKILRSGVMHSLPSPAGEGGPAGPDEGWVAGCCPQTGNHESSALLSPLRGQLQSPCQVPPTAVALRHAPAGAAPRGKPFTQKPPRGFYTVGRSFLFYCLIALTTLFRSCSSSQTILTGWL